MKSYIQSEFIHEIIIHTRKSDEIIYEFEIKNSCNIQSTMASLMTLFKYMKCIMNI